MQTDMNQFRDDLWDGRTLSIVVGLQNGFLIDDEGIFPTTFRARKYVKEIQKRLGDAENWVSHIVDGEDWTFTNDNLKAKITIAFRKLVEKFPQ